MALLRVARAALCALLLLLLLAPTASAAARSSTYDARSFLLDGERVLILSGSIHYQRVLPADWPRALALAAEAGFNAVQTYVLWDMHEPERGNISFSGANDIVAFAAIAQSLGLRLDVRIGPYICGEHFNGGVPIWMRGAESGAECFRCRDAAWEAFTVHVLSAVVGARRRAVDAGRARLPPAGRERVRRRRARLPQVLRRGGAQRDDGRALAALPRRGPVRSGQRREREPARGRALHGQAGLSLTLRRPALPDSHGLHDAARHNASCPRRHVLRVIVLSSVCWLRAR